MQNRPQPGRPIAPFKTDGNIGFEFSFAFQPIVDARNRRRSSPLRPGARAAREPSASVLLRVIGRAGVGVDNVDLDAATEAGVLVNEHARRQCRLRGRAHPGADGSAHGAPYPAGHRLYARRQVGKEKAHGPSSCAARRWASSGLGSYRPRGGQAREGLRDAPSWRTTRYVTSKLAPGPGRRAGRLADPLRLQRLHLAACGHHPRNPGDPLARGLRPDENGRPHRQLRARRAGG